MFGYVRPRLEELRVWEEARYRAVYCGLCRCLGRRYGLKARFLVNYDITFLCLLLEGLQSAGETSRCFCPANPLRRKNCVPITPSMEYAADICVILGVLSLEDRRRDSRGARALAAAAAQGIFRGAYRTAAAAQPEFAALARERLAMLAALEAEHCPEMDRAADAFAGLLAHCADPMLPAQKRPAQQLLYHIGRFIYLTDALDDLQKDAQSGNYNPLIYRFSCENGKLSPENREYVRMTILQSAAMACSALPLCELRSNESILENITSQGLGTVLCAVDRGVFQARQKMKATGEA